MPSPDPVLHLLCGPYGAGKSTLAERVLIPLLHLRFINANVLAAEQWPDDPSGHAHDASRLAERLRREAMARRESFISETVFSHPSKLALVRDAVAAGYQVTLHVVIVPEDLSIARVRERVDRGGHAVPEDKARARYQRLWHLVAQACLVAQRVRVYDNSTGGQALRQVARLADGRIMHADWPTWTPRALIDMADGS